MNLLAFDTSTEALSVALGCAAQVWTHDGEGGAQSSAHLIPACLGLLAQAGRRLADLDAIAFGRGPGSFTGLRTACAVAQGLGAGSGRPLVPVDTLLALAEDARLRAAPGSTNGGLRVWAALDARMGEVYSAQYRWDGSRWHTETAPSLHAPEHWPLADRVPPEDASPLPVCLAGSGAALCEAAVRQVLPPGFALVVDPGAQPRAQAMLRLVPALMASGQAVPAAQAMPLYLRDKVAQTTAEREALALQKSQAKGACAQASPQAHWRDMRDSDLDRVCAVEQTAYSHPWTRGHFADSLRSGYRMRLLEVGTTLVGYSVVMKGVDEAHLLNITVRPDWQRKGWGAQLLHELCDWARARSLESVWLEVRASNEAAQALYLRHGFRRAGLRKGYYPALGAAREDAVVMCRTAAAPPQAAADSTQEAHP